jgi:hypothetical protein
MLMTAMDEHNGAIASPSPVSKEDPDAIVCKKGTLLGNSRDRIVADGNCGPMHFLYPSARRTR